MTQSEARIIHFDPRRMRAAPAKAVRTEPREMDCGWFDHEAERIRQRAREIAQAMQDWPGQVAPLSEADILRHLPALEASMRDAPGLWAETRVARVRDALRSAYGDARLVHAALMTPQEILALPRVGQAGLARLIEELQVFTPLSIPELVTGTGKAGLERLAYDRGALQPSRNDRTPGGALGELRAC